MSECLSENTLAGFVEGRLDGQARAAAEAHLARCTACREVLAAATRGHLENTAALSAQTRQAPDTVPEAPETAAAGECEWLGRGARLGRYVILGAVGAGGMGVVYAAYDPELDRKVALKLIRPDAAPPSRRDDLRALLLREAQAMARLSHPNVIAVHDVGTFEDQVFLAMEFVEGRTLTDWLAEKDRPWHKVLDLFLQAGAGLDAAHQAGLVHRDFKPENVLVGWDGRVRVTDFGLARFVEKTSLATSATDQARPALAARSPAPAALTRTGVLVGTPRYMSPEQLAGKSVDARSDVFSFCVALYEALCGELPFAGTTADEVEAAIACGEVREPPRSRVPPWLARVLLRGLSARREERFPTTRALLDALRADPRVRRRRWLLAAGVALAIAAFPVGQALFGGSARSLCEGAAEKLAGVWDGARRAAVAANFLRSAKPYAHEAWTAVQSTLDRYAQSWAAMHREACEATRVRGEQSEDLLDRRMDCLSQRLGNLRALTALFAQDPTVAERAVQAVHALSPLDACADARALLARVRPPEEPAARAAVDAVSVRIAEAKALNDAGKYAQGLGVARAAVSAALPLGYRPVLAGALLWQGWLQTQQGRYLEAAQSMRDAAFAAEAGGDDVAVARAAAGLVRLGANQPSLRSGSEDWGRLGLAVLDRLGSNAEVEGDLFGALGNLESQLGRHAAAVTYAERALRAREKALGPEHPLVATSLHTLGMMFYEAGDDARALPLLQQSLRIREKVLGRAHPDVSRALGALGDVFTGLERYDEALAHYRRSLALREQALGPESVPVAYALRDLGDALERVGRPEEAKQAYERVARIRERVFGASDPERGWTLRRIAQALLSLGQVGEALPVLERALRFFERLPKGEEDVASGLARMALAHNALGRRSQALELARRAVAIAKRLPGKARLNHASARGAHAKVLADLGRREEARAEFERALVMREAMQGRAHSEVAETLIGLGDVYIESHALPEARRTLERATAILEKSERDPTLLAAARFALARALWAGSTDRVRARRLAAQARAAWAKAGARSRLQLAKADAWLSAAARR
jgi:tetratricopeptide (TPR) repeat protein/predicted Ser/Thr protein kinase